MALIDLALAAVGAAGVAAATRARILSRAATAARQFPPTGRLIAVAGRQVHVHQAGQGPDLVLIHGASGNSRDFTFSMVEKLAPRYRVTAFDRPGLGWSDPLPESGADPAAQAQHLRQAAARLGLDRPIVLGQSYGGTIALAWALAAPQEVAALVLVAAASNPWQGSLGPWYRMTASWPGYHLLLPLVSGWASPARINRAVADVFAPDSAPPGYADYIGAALTLRLGTLRTNSRQINALLPHIREMSRRYGRIDCPAELIHGTADTTVPLAVHSEPLSRQLPGAHLTTLPGAGHMPHHSHEAEVIAAIDRAARRARLH